MKKSQAVLGIDASRSTRVHPTGVERYSTEVIKALLKVNKEFDLRLYTPKLIESMPKKVQRVIPFPRLWTVLRLSAEMLFRKPDALFVPAHVFPFFSPKDSFITIHDVAFERYPSAYGVFQSLYLGFSTKRAIRRAKKVFVPTAAVKKDVIKFYKSDSKKIVVIHHGRMPTSRLSASEIDVVRKHYHLEKDEPLFFFIGRLETKKNLLVLLDAWEIVQKKYSTGRLFLGGMYGHGWNDLFNRIESKKLRGTILAPGFISERDASALFSLATALVLPSREEGFGLPVLQAFESDCSVICSSIPALREVAGGAALYADPGDPKAFASQMMKLLEKPAVKKELIKKGEARLKEFSWEKAAELMMKEFADS